MTVNARVRLRGVDLAVGDLFGSCTANVLILALADLVMPRRQVSQHMSGVHALTASLAVGLGVTAISHLGADHIAPFVESNYPGVAKFSLTSGLFWLIVIATTLGVLLSFIPARKLESVGASRIETSRFIRSAFPQKAEARITSLSMRALKQAWSRFEKWVRTHPR